MADEKTQDGVVRNLEIIGEAQIICPRSSKRNSIVQDYFGIDLKIIWRIINEDLRVFKARLQ